MKKPTNIERNTIVEQIMGTTDGPKQVGEYGCGYEAFIDLKARIEYLDAVAEVVNDLRHDATQEMFDAIEIDGTRPAQEEQDRINCMHEIVDSMTQQEPQEPQEPQKPEVIVVRFDSIHDFLNIS